VEVMGFMMAVTILRKLQIYALELPYVSRIRSD
jgi:hypothetical protein